MDEAHRRVYHSTLGLRVIKKKKDGRTWMILVESDSSTIDGSHPWLLAYRQYTSTRSFAQMFASSPPVPAGGDEGEHIQIK